MIMGGDKKKMATLIVDKMGGKKDEAGKSANSAAFDKMASEPAKEEVDEGLLSAAEEVKAAMAGDPKDLALALKNFFYLCDSEEDAKEEPAEPSPILG